MSEIKLVDMSKYGSGDDSITFTEVDEDGNYLIMCLQNACKELGGNSFIDEVVAIATRFARKIDGDLTFKQVYAGEETFFFINFNKISLEQARELVSSLPIPDMQFVGRPVKDGVW